MKKLMMSAAAAIGLLALPSCIQNETTVTIQKDGSGTITERTVFGAQMTAMFAQMAAMGAEGEDPLSKLKDEDAAKARAAALGEGVTFEKIEAVNENGRQGVVVTYKFEDINQIKITPGESMSALSDEPVEAEANPVTFALVDGRLTVTMPKPEAGDAAPDDAAELDAMAEMMKEMLGDMKVGMKLVFPDGVAGSNAQHRAENVVTLMEMDMSVVVKDDDNFKKFMALSGEQDPMKAMAAMAEVDGVSIETQETITVDLQ